MFGLFYPYEIGFSEFFKKGKWGISSQRLVFTDLAEVFFFNFYE